MRLCSPWVSGSRTSKACQVRCRVAGLKPACTLPTPPTSAGHGCRDEPCVSVQVIGYIKSPVWAKSDGVTVCLCDESTI